MKQLLIIFFLTSSTFVFAQKNAFSTCLSKNKAPQIRLYLNTQPKGFLQNQEKVLQSFLLPINSTDYALINKKNYLYTTKYNVLNPYEVLSPLDAVIGGAINFFLNQ